MTIPRRTKPILSIGAILVLGLPVVALVILLNMDWNRAKPWLSARISAAIERPFMINGELALNWERHREKFFDQQHRWRDTLPWPHVVAHDIHLGNPAVLAQGPELASVGIVSFSLDPLALLARTISIPVLHFENPLITLQRNAEGQNNWTFAQKTAASWRLDLHRIALSQGALRLNDKVTRTDVTAAIATTRADPAYGVSWAIKGTFNGETISGSGKAGAILALQQQLAPYPIVAEVKVGGTTIGLTGTLTKPSALAALDMQLQVSGLSMAQLYPLTGIVLPETPRFSTAGHLTATLGAHSGHWLYDQFTGTVGGSDLGGKLEYQATPQRGRLNGSVSSHLLRLSDLAPLIGADSRSSQHARGVAARQPPDKVLPVETFKSGRWSSFDADVHFSAARITRDKELPISMLNAHIVLQDGVLALRPLNFSIAGGSMVSSIELDGSGDPALLRAQLAVSARHLKLKQLFPTLSALRASVGEINGEVALSATGNSVARMLASSNGEIKALINEGTISKLLLEEIGLNLGNVVLSRLFGDRQVKLNCMATDFVVEHGLMHTRSFIVDTDAAILHVKGDINLDTERMDLTLKSESKGLRIFSLRAPLYLRGSFKQPDVSVDKGVLALRAGGALALAAAAPLAALLPLINTGPGANSACGALLSAARIKPVAPAPGAAAP